MQVPRSRIRIKTIHQIVRCLTKKKKKRTLRAVFLPAAMLPSYMHRYLNKKTNSVCLAHSLK